MNFVLSKSNRPESHYYCQTKRAYQHMDTLGAVSKTALKAAVETASLLPKLLVGTAPVPMADVFELGYARKTSLQSLGVLGVANVAVACVALLAPPIPLGLLAGTLGGLEGIVLPNSSFKQGFWLGCTLGTAVGATLAGLLYTAGETARSVLQLVVYTVQRAAILSGHLAIDTLGGLVGKPIVALAEGLGDTWETNLKCLDIIGAAAKKSMATA